MWENYLVDVLNSISAVVSLIGCFGVGYLFIGRAFNSRLNTNIVWITAIALLIAILIPSKESLELMLLE